MLEEQSAPQSAGYVCLIFARTMRRARIVRANILRRQSWPRGTGSVGPGAQGQ